MQVSETVAELFKGLAKFRSNLKQPLKNANNPFFKSKYVPLENVISVIDDAIVDTGLGYAQEIVDDKVFTIITHDNGEYMILGGSNVKPVKPDMQGEGSAITYAKRYSLSLAFGIASDADDDGNAASGQSKPQAKQTRQTPKPASQAKPKTIDYRSYMVKESERFKKIYEVDDATMWELVNSNHQGFNATDIDTALNHDEKTKQSVIKWLKLQTDKREQELQELRAQLS